MPLETGAILNGNLKIAFQISSEVNNMEDEVLLFDDFFTPPNDPGVPFEIQLRGKTLKFRMKKGVNFGDMVYAQSVAAVTKINEKGELVLESIDQAVLNTEIAVRCLLEWPFKKLVGPFGQERYESIPINRDNMNALDGDVAQALSVKMQEILQARGASIEAPFEKQSGVVS